MSRRMRAKGTDSAAPCAPGDGLVVQKLVFRSIRHDRGAGSRFRCFLTILLAPEPFRSPADIRLVDRDEDQVRRVDGPCHLFFVRLLDLDSLDRDGDVRRVHPDDLALPASELPARDEDLVALPHGDRPRDLPVELLPEGGVDVGGQRLAPLVPRRLRGPLPLFPGLRAHHRWTLTRLCWLSPRSGATARRPPARRAP